MAIRGSLKEASLPDVLQLLSMGKKTGCLSVTHRNNFGSIYFDKGKICYAAIVNRRDRLGDILLKSGVITGAQLQQAIDAQSKQRDKRLGDVLVSLGIISREGLHGQIRIQIEEAVYFLFTWAQGTFNFEADLTPEEQDFLVSINPESLLLEGARRVDEWGLIEKKIPSFDIVFDLDRRKLEENRGNLSKEQEVILPLIDGRLDVAAIVEESGLIEFDVGKALYGLATAGFLHRVGKTKSSEVTAPDTRVEEHRNLGIAFFKTGMLDEAEREFRRVVELRPGDLQARFSVGLVHLRLGRWDDAIADFAAATHSRGASPWVYHNLAYAHERRGEYGKARAALHEAVARGADGDARVHTSFGVLALREGDLPSARASLARARALLGEGKPSAAWYHYAGLEAWLSQRADDAVALLREGTERYPHAAVLFNNLSAALDRQRMYPEALAAAERGAVEEPGIAQLHKNIGDALYRSGRFDEAYDAFQRAVKFNEQIGPDAWFKLGNIRLRRNERADAIRCWERALVLDPDNAIVRQNLTAAKAPS